MAFFDTTWYLNGGDQATTGYYAVPVFQTSHVYAAGALVRPTAPAVGSERVFVCILAGTSGTEPAWVNTRGAKNTSTTPIFQECTGASAVNGDATNTPAWSAVTSLAVTLGQIIKRNNGASYWICSTAGTAGASEPAWPNNTAGTTQSDGTVTWTCLGVVGNFSGGGAPFARLVAACAVNWFAAGNTIYVGDNHAESQATLIQPAPTLSSSTFNRILCHNHSGSYPPAATDLTTGASISTTGAVNIVWSPAGTGGLYIRGVTFKTGVGQSSSSLYNLNVGNSYFKFENCDIELSATGSAATIGVLGGGVVEFNNTTVKFAATGHSISVNNSQFIWRNTGLVLVSGSSVPTSLISFLGQQVTLEAIDLSQCTGNIINPGSNLGTSIVKDCKLNASSTFATPATLGDYTQVIRSDSSGTAYKSARYAYEGTETTETSITRVGGAVDPTGQAQSRKIVATANSQWVSPFRAEPFVVYNSTVAGNVTATVCGTINAGAIPNNDELWAELEYLGTASFPLGNILNSTKTNVLTAGGTTGVNGSISSDGSTWNGGGSGAGWSPFKIVFQLDTTHNPQPQFAGYIMARIRAAKPSTTWYIDPKITLS